MPPAAHFAQRSAPAIASAVAIFEITGDPDAPCRALGISPPAVGRAALRTIPHVDTVLAIRPSERVLLLTPHGGAAACRALSRALLDAGVERSTAPPAWPEAADEVEAHALTALAHARGERAIAHLLSQPERWASGQGEVPPAVAGELQRLLRPPLVVATGPANVGKSSLINALASQTIARVADRPGVTRDAVAADLELDGLVVRWLDAPGADQADDDPVLTAAQQLAAQAIAMADLVLWCQDARQDTKTLTPRANRLLVAMRADLAPGHAPPWAHATVSAHTGQGLPELTRLIRQRLVSDETLAHRGAWAFWRPAT